jgi:hemoglobin
MTESQTQSQWERVGGEPAVKAVLDRFYEGVLDEPQLAGFFENVAVDDIKPHLARCSRSCSAAPAPTPT